MSGRVSAIAPDGLRPGASTPGVVRELAVETGQATLMRARAVPARLVHRDVNPLDEPQEIVLTVVGDGPLVVNVDGPDPE